MYCCHCGSPIPEQSRFCPLCGGTLPAQDAPRQIVPGTAPPPYPPGAFSGPSPAPPRGGYPPSGAPGPADRPYPPVPPVYGMAPYAPPYYPPARPRPRRHPKVWIGILTLGHTLLVLLGTFLLPGMLKATPFTAILPDLLIFCTQIVCMILYLWLADRRAVAGLFIAEAAYMVLNFAALIKMVTGIEILLRGRYGASFMLLALLLQMGLRCIALWLTGREYHRLSKQKQPSKPF